MTSLASKAHFRQRVIKYAEKYGVTQSSNRFRISRKAIYDWKAKYDGGWKSLMDKSHRPHGHPKEHTAEEYALIRRYWEKNKDDRMVLWDKLRRQGYQRSYKSMCRAIRRMQLGDKREKRGRYKPKPYANADNPGQKVQIDVKYVPSRCIAGETKYYQYTAIDECTRLVYREMYDEHSTYSSEDFIKKAIDFYPFRIEEVQTDNGSEWTKALISNDPNDKTSFEEELERQGIKYHRIRIATPRHNGKVERQHRTDEKRFYKKMRMYCLEDGRKQLKRYNKWSNSIPKICLDFKSPNEVLREYQNRDAIAVEPPIFA